jgi:MazG family protein
MENGKVRSASREEKSCSSGSNARINLTDSSQPPVGRLLEIVARLRAPDGCPWDREQTHESLVPNLIEECYEVLDAIHMRDDNELKEELGDLLLQVAMHSQMAAEQGRFTFDDVAEVVAEKLVRRHPHVFGEQRLPDSEAVLKQWDAIKKKEKQNRKSLLDGVPKGLPALAAGQKLQSKAARNGFDWPDAEGPLAKIEEELAEVKAAATAAECEEELGDLLFSMVNFIRKKGFDAEQTLLRANHKFKERFQKMEQLAIERGLDFASLSLKEQDELWNEIRTVAREG